LIVVELARVDEFEDLKRNFWCSSELIRSMEKSMCLMFYQSMLI